MALEFSAPRGIYGRSANENGDLLRAIAAAAPARPAAVQAAYDRATDASWLTRGRMELKADAYNLAYDAFHRAVALNPHLEDALAGLTQTAAAARKTGEEMSWLKALASADSGNAPVRIELSRVLASTGDFKGGAEMASAALRIAPEDPRAGEQLASVFADASDVEHLAPLADALVTHYPAREEGHYYRATALFLRGRTQEAIDEARQVVAANPNHARAFNLLGAACATAGQRDCAQAAFESSIRANARDPSTYVNLGTFFLQAGDAGAATGAFAEALSLDPESSSARSGLEQARNAAKP
jgi:tetratricopeptide (TPR) repeat protein